MSGAVAYPAFLGLPETRQLLRSLARPTITRLAGSLLLAGGGLAALSAMPKRWLYRSPWAHPLAPAVNDVFLWAAFVLLGYVALTLASTLIDRRASVPPDAGEAAGESPARGPRAGLEPARRLAVVAVLLVVSAFAWINVADLIGLPSAGACSCSVASALTGAITSSCRGSGRGPGPPTCRSCASTRRTSRRARRRTSPRSAAG
jgi:hypothetical protein